MSLTKAESLLCFIVNTRSAFVLNMHSAFILTMQCFAYALNLHRGYVLNMHTMHSVYVLNMHRNFDFKYATCNIENIGLPYMQSSLCIIVHNFKFSIRRNIP